MIYKCVLFIMHLYCVNISSTSLEFHLIHFGILLACEFVVPSNCVVFGWRNTPKRTRSLMCSATIRNPS